MASYFICNNAVDSRRRYNMMSHDVVSTLKRRREGKLIYMPKTIYLILQRPVSTKKIIHT